MSNILLVEEDDAVREVVWLILASVPEYEEITEVDNGESGLRHLDEGTFDLLVTDWHMREMHGHLMVGAAYARACHLPPIIVITGGDTQECQKEFTKRLPRGHYLVCLGKPFDRDVFLAEIKRALSSG